MGFFRATAAARDAATVAAAAQEQILPDPTPPAYTVGLANIPGLLGGWLPRDTALMVPSFARGLDLITGIASGMPLAEFNGDGTPAQPYGFTARPSYEPGVPRVVTIRRTVADLVCDGRAYWVIQQAVGDRYPRAVQRFDPMNVSRGPNGWLVNGQDVEDWRVIEFDSGTVGALAAGAMALATALDLEAAARNYARTPMPSTALVPAAGAYELDADEVRNLLEEWETSRQTRATAYLNRAVELKTFGWSAADLEMVTARQHAATEVARVLNLDPMWVGANMPGSSLTYQNIQDAKQVLLESTVLPLLRVIEQRLSLLSDSTRTFRFDSTAFLRANLTDRVNAFTAYLTAGVMTTEEVRDLEPLVRKGEVPA